MQADVEAIMRACDMDADCPFKGMVNETSKVSPDSCYFLYFCYRPTLLHIMLVFLLVYNYS